MGKTLFLGDVVWYDLIRINVQLCEMCYCLFEDKLRGNIA